MAYKKPHILKHNAGNNALSYEIRRKLGGSEPTLAIPSLIEGSLEDLEIGDIIVFEEVENGKLKSCIGLKNFVRLSNTPTLQHSNIPTLQHSNIPITIFDNHNHALYFWLEAIRVGKVGIGFELIHIDEHSDLWENKNSLDLERATIDERYAWEFTNLSCNVGNYISPMMKVGGVGKIIRIENEFELDQYRDYTPSENSILNLDLDFFAPEMDFIEEEKKIRLIRNLLPQVRCVTIATSPYFIDQGRAIKSLQKILNEL